MKSERLRLNLLGFTMIELLVVIAVIGVLAVAVLSSINPLEQINKGRDTKKRSDSAQILNAIDRYYASQEEYPFDVSVVADQALSGNNINNKYSSILDALVDTKEIKKGFKTRLIQEAKAENYLYLYVDAGGKGTSATDGDVEGVYVCFAPSSNSFKKQAQDHKSDWFFLQSSEVGYYICLP
ncbi:MAG: type II secretion system protein [bacterium]|nr:type II secretion system protein [bacterium]